jgi:hypothetical protein
LVVMLCWGDVAKVEQENKSIYGMNHKLRMCMYLEKWPS